MPQEIERKFVVSPLPDHFAAAPSEHIEQGYLPLPDDGPEVRVRRIGDRAVLTVKRGAGLRREEVEAEISVAAFEALWPLTVGRRIEKRRFVREHAGQPIELDVYAGALEGLIVAEAEFPSEAASARFEPPDWLGREVTDDARYGNRRLALDGRPEPEDGA